MDQAQGLPRKLLAQWGARSQQADTVQCVHSVLEEAAACGPEEGGVCVADTSQKALGLEGCILLGGKGRKRVAIGGNSMT